ncbi:MAG: hypothetical protein ABIE92_03480 [bacterium]
MENDLGQRFPRQLGIILIFVLLALCVNGCIEHRYVYQSDLRGICDFHYTASGDSTDIYTPEKSFPDTVFFKLSTSTEVDTAGNEKFILEAQARISGDSLPTTLGLAEVPWTDVFLSHPTELKKSSFILAATFQFDQTFKSRKRNLLEGERWDYIPVECRALEAEDDSNVTAAEKAILEEKYAAGMIVWNTERYKLRVRQILDYSLQRHPEVAVPQNWLKTALEETDSAIQEYASQLEFELLDFSSLEWWEDLSPRVHQILSENLNIIGDSTLQTEIIHVSDMLELRHQITEDLMDESFSVNVDLPGRIINSNAEGMDTGVLLWNFNGEDLADADYVIEATSLYIFADRVIGLFVLLAAILFAIYLKKRKPAGNQSETAQESHDHTPPVGHG